MTVPGLARGLHGAAREVVFCSHSASCRMNRGDARRRIVAVSFHCTPVVDRVPREANTQNGRTGAGSQGVLGPLSFLIQTRFNASTPSPGSRVLRMA